MFRATEFMLVLCASFVLTWAALRHSREPQVAAPAVTRPGVAADASSLAKAEPAPDRPGRVARPNYVRVVLPEPRRWTDPVQTTAQ